MFTNRGILFRSYLVIVGGLIVVSVLLDAGFASLQEAWQEEKTDQFLTTTVRLVEDRLMAAPRQQWNEIARELSGVIKVRVQILEADAVMSTSRTNPLQALVDETGKTSYLYAATALNASILLGPVERPGEPWWAHTVPTLFYLSIFVVVGIWLRPVLAELNLITRASQQFAQDYREPLATADKTTHLTGLARNLDDMSSRISHLIQSQKELTAALSHEMRTPLARIRMALAVLGNDADPATRNSLDEVDQDIGEIDQLIGSMLSYARLDHPDTTMCWQFVPLQEWLRALVSKITQSAGKIEVVVQEGVDAIWVDARLMGIALSNLLVNAARYANARIRISVNETTDGFELIVEDDGEGIPADQLATVFKAFKRLDSSRNRQTGGFGLGLAIVARIAQLHGGTARAARSVALGGAQISLFWPKDGYATAVASLQQSMNV